MGMVELDQVSVASDGRLKAVFSNNDVLVLSAGGSLFGYISEGTLQRQTCEFAVSKYAEQLCAAIEFRNMHLDSLVWCRAMAKKHADAVFVLKYPVSYVEWPTSIEAAVRDGKLEHASANGSVSLQSEDATARVVVRPHSQRFAVCYPLLVHQERSAEQQEERDQASTFTYVWQTQVFAEADHPPRWQYPLQLAQAAMSQPELLCTPAAQPTKEAKAPADAGTNDAHAHASADQNTCLNTEQPDGAVAGGSTTASAATTGMQEQPAQMHSGKEPQQDAKQAHAFDPSSASVLQRTTYLPQAVTAATEGPNFVEEGSWWTACARDPLPEQDLIQMQWSREAHLQFIPASHEVHAWVARDESLITTSNGGAFLRHVRGAGLDNLYRASALPVHAWTADGKERYPFGTLGQRVLDFRQRALAALQQPDSTTAAAVAACGAADSTDTGPAVLSSAVHRRQTVPGLGTFTVFEDGRVRVRYNDRTLVSVDRWHRQAEVLHRDGKRAVVSVSAPHGATEYVRAAVEFATWAFMTQEDHAAAAAAKNAVDAQLAATQRMQALCDYSVSGTLPQLAPAQSLPSALPDDNAQGAATHAAHSRHASAGAVLAAQTDATQDLPPRTQSAAPLRASADATAHHEVPERTASALRPARSVAFADENTGAYRDSTGRYSTLRSSNGVAQASGLCSSGDVHAPFPNAPALSTPSTAFKTPQLGGSMSQHKASDPHMVLGSDGGVHFTCAKQSTTHAPYSAPAADQAAAAQTAMPALAEGMSPDDRDSVVQQWLRRNAEVLARLD